MALSLLPLKTLRGAASLSLLPLKTLRGAASLSPLSALWLDVFVNSFLPIVAFWVAGKINPFFFAFAGSLVGFLTLLPFVLKRAYFGLFFRREYLFPLFMIGFFGSALPIILLVSALEYTTPSNAAILLRPAQVKSALAGEILERNEKRGARIAVL